MPSKFSNHVQPQRQDKITQQKLLLIRNRNETNREYYIHHRRWFWDWPRLGRSIAQARQSDHHLRAAQEPSRRDDPGKHRNGLSGAEYRASIAAATKKLTAEFPTLNVLINNAGIMQIDDAADAIDDGLLVSTVTTNLLGPIRLTSALIDHLKKQESAVIIYNSSVLAYVPLALAAVYSSTKAALHSYTLSQRYKLKNTSVSVLEIAPPWVQTDLLGSNNEPRAMPLAEFIEETIRVLGTDAQEVLVERAKPLRNNPGPNEGAFVTEFNDLMVQAPAQQQPSSGTPLELTINNFVERQK